MLWLLCFLLFGAYKKTAYQFAYIYMTYTRVANVSLYYTHIKYHSPHPHCWHRVCVFLLLLLQVVADLAYKFEYVERWPCIPIETNDFKR